MVVVGFFVCQTPSETLRPCLHAVSVCCHAGAHVLLPRREHQDEDTVGPHRIMAASRSSRVTRSSVGHNGLDENFCGRTLRNRSIAPPEETAASPVPRARSPKKKQETRQDGQSQQSPSQGKVADPKSSPVEGEPWTGSRKRSTPCPEKEGCPERSETCMRGKGVPEPSPQPKKAKRGPPSEESSRGAEEEEDGEEAEDDDDDDDDNDTQSIDAESLGSVFDDIKDNGSEALHGLHSNREGHASPVLTEEIKCEVDEVEVTVGDAHRKASDGMAGPPNIHKASNGLVEVKAEPDGPSAPIVDAKPANSPPLLNGSETGAPMSPDLIVPCRNSTPMPSEAPGPPAPLAPTPESLAEDPVPELVVAEEQEVEVDMAGEACSAQEELVVTEAEGGTNGCPPSPVVEVVAVASSFSSARDINNSPGNHHHQNNSHSGETPPPLEPPLAPTPSPTEPASSPPTEPASSPHTHPACSPTDLGCNPSPPSFTEPHEHRYTLRTSPRRAPTTGRASSPKANFSPPRDNGFLGEGEVVVEQEDMVEVEEEQVVVVEEEAVEEVVMEASCPATPEEPSLSDLVGPLLSEVPASVEAGDGGGAGVSLGGQEDIRPLKDNEAEGSKAVATATARQGVEEEEEEEEEPDVYYFESDHLALKHNKEYVGETGRFLFSFCHFSSVHVTLCSLKTSINFFFFSLSYIRKLWVFLLEMVDVNRCSRSSIHHWLLFPTRYAMLFLFDNVGYQ